MQTACNYRFNDKLYSINMCNSDHVTHDTLQVNAKGQVDCGLQTSWKGIKNFKAGLMIAVIIGVYHVFVMPVTVMALLQVVFNVSINFPTRRDHEIPMKRVIICSYFFR